jgi:tetratricopeptide (TPR) repeat protein
MTNAIDFCGLRIKQPMKFGYFLFLRKVLFFLGLIFICFSTSAQKKPIQTSKPINIDRELEEQAAPDRALSYYHYSLAKWYEDKEDLAKALSEMKAALKYNRDSARIHLDMAQILERMEKFSEALEYAQEAIRLDPDDPEPHWFLANLFFRTPGQGGLEKAILELEKLKELTPGDERVYYALGRAYFENYESDKALEAYEKLQDLSPKSDHGYREIAKYYSRSGDFDKAVEYFNKGLEIQPDSAESLWHLGELYLKLRRDAEAVPVFRKLLEVAGNRAPVNLKLAEALVNTGKYSEAHDILDKLSKQDALMDRTSRILQARAQIGLHKLPEAVETLQSLLELDPHDADARFYLGNAFEESGRYEDAVEVFTYLIENTDSDTEANRANRLLFQQHLAADYMELRAFEKAISLYQEMARNDSRSNSQLLNAYRVSRQFNKALHLGKNLYEKNPEDIHTVTIYAKTLADVGKSQEGVEILSKLIQSNPQNIDLYVFLSRIHLQDKRYDDAKEVLRQAEDRGLGGKESEKLKYQLAEIYEKQQDYNRAESTLKEILKTNPNNAAVLNFIGYMLADRGIRLEEALQYVKDALAIEPYNGYYLDSLGWAFFKMNDLENAEKYLLEADKLAINDPVIDEHLGDLYFRTGDLEKAKDFYQRSVNIQTEPEDLQKVRRKLERIQETLQEQESNK